MLKYLVAALAYSCSTVSASAESTKLSCKLERGWNWSLEVDFEENTLSHGHLKFPIVEKNDEWLVAMSSDSAHADEMKGMLANRAYASSNQFVLNRFSGELWATSFGYFSSNADGSDGEFGMQFYHGRCTRGF